MRAIASELVLLFALSPAISVAQTSGQQPAPALGMRPAFAPSPQPAVDAGPQPAVVPGAQHGPRPGVVPGAQPMFAPSAQPAFTHGQQPAFAPGRQPTFVPGQQPAFAPSQQPAIATNPQPAFAPGQQSGFVPGQPASFLPGQQPAEEEPSLAEVGVRTGVDQRGQFLTQGDKICIHVSAATKVDIYVYAIQLEADGSAGLLFPNFRDRNNRVPAGKDRWILNDRTPIGIQVAAPFGPERIRVIVTPLKLVELEKLVDDFPQNVPALSPDEATKLNTWCEAGANAGALEIQETEFECREAGGRYLPLPAPSVQ